MNTQSNLFTALFIAGTTLLAIPSFANTTQTATDNTAINTRDANYTTLTPEDQSRGSAQDVEMTRMVRNELVKDNTLSTNAKNIKVITINNVVTLRGVVNSEIEKNKVEQKAKDVAVNQKVENQLSVVGTKRY